MSDPASRTRHNLDRLVFFSDAVFAIAITLLVIDLRVPDRLPALTNAGLTQALGEIVPALIGFVLSFTVVGVFWASHHRAFGLLARSDERLLRRNLLFLFTIAIMPFPTALLSRYQPFPIAQQIYTGALFMAAMLQLRLFRLALAPGRYLAADVDRHEAARIVRRAWAVPIGPALAFAVATFTRSPFSMMALITMPLVIRIAEAEPWRKRQPLASG